MSLGCVGDGFKVTTCTCRGSCCFTIRGSLLSHQCFKLTQQRLTNLLMPFYNVPLCCPTFGSKDRNPRTIKMDAKIAHLQIIQGVIQRMANTSFGIRGWTVSLVAAVFALADPSSERLFFTLAYFPVLAFWVLDGFYVGQERAFRNLYNDVRIRKEDQIDFSMTTNFNSSYWAGGCFSMVNLVFYLAVAAVTLLLMYTLPTYTSLNLSTLNSF